MHALNFAILDEMKRRFLKLSPLFISFIGIAAASFSHAALNLSAPQGIPRIPTPPLTSVLDIQGLLCGLVLWVFWGLIVFSIVMFLMGGYRYVTSGGEPEKVSSANKTLLYAAIAVVVALVATGVPYIIDTFLNLGGGTLGAACPSVF